MNLKFILEQALLAPSADNDHKVSMSIEGQSIRCFHTEASLPKEGGYKWALKLLSLGAFSENLSIAASLYGLKTEMLINPSGLNSDEMLRFNFRSCEKGPDTLSEFISKRHTNRNIIFKGPKLTNDEKTDLGLAAHLNEGAQLLWLDDFSQRIKALRLMQKAESERFRSSLLHRELFNAIRFDVGWKQSCTTGLPPGSLSVEPILQKTFQMLGSWSLMKKLNTMGVHQLLGFRSCVIPCLLAPHLGLLSVKELNVSSIVNLGRSFQRLWLEITKMGLVLQPVPASAIYALPNSIIDGISNSIQNDLRSGWKSILIKNEIPLMIFRLGRAKPSPVLASRPQLNSFLINASSEVINSPSRQI